MSFWTDEKVEALLALNAKNKSASQIGDLIGTSRNAVIGKLHRLGMAYAASDKAIQGRRMRMRPKAKPTFVANNNAPARKATAFDFGRAPSIPVDPYVPTDEELDIPVHERKALVDLEPNDCRWPIGDPQEKGFGFCGKHKEPGTPYCEHHARKAFVPLDVARRERKQAQGERQRVREKEDA